MTIELSKRESSALVFRSQGLSYKEVAMRLGITEEDAKHIVHDTANRIIRRGEFHPLLDAAKRCKNFSVYQTAPKGFRCIQCGKCCQLGIGSDSILNEDFERWKSQGRHDILISWGMVLQDNGNYEHLNEIWIDPRNGYQVDRCPWLRRNPKKNTFRCLIQDTKPIMCRNFPYTMAKAKRVGCPGVFPSDYDASQEPEEEDWEEPDLKWVYNYTLID